MLTFFYDVACPYAYLASRRVAQLGGFGGGVPVEWRPVLLGGLYGATKAPQGKAGSATDVMADAKKTLFAQDLRREAARQGAPLMWNPAHPVRSVEAMRLAAAAPEDVRPAVSAALFQAYWEEGRRVDDEGFLDDVARRFGLDPATRHSDAAKDSLRSNTEEAVALGGFGVPIFKVKDRIFWGQDRLHLALRAAGFPDVPQAAPLRLAPSPRPSPPDVTWFHDFASPWSFLSSIQMKDFAARTGAKVVARPILVGALFNAIGTANVPMLTIPEAKRAHLALDLQDNAAYVGTALNFPTVFPIRSVLLCRVAIVEPATTDALYHAAWVQDRDMSNPVVVSAVLSDAGFDGEALVAATQQQSVKDALKANTDAAFVAGACGVPSFKVGDKLVWGQDRLHVVEDMVNGWEDGPTSKL